MSVKQRTKVAFEYLKASCPGFHLLASSVQLDCARRILGLSGV